MRKFHSGIKWSKRALIALIFIIVIWILFHIELFMYGIGQLRGQLSIVRNTRLVAEVIADPATPDSIRTRLTLIGTIRRFGIDSLGLKDTPNYTTYYDQHGQPLLWVLTCSEPYRISAFHWSFPVVGEVSYKGFFIKAKGEQEELTMRQKGYDTDLGEVSAWSTLGWFKDPVLSSMLSRGTGSLAELVLHEMTHATLYVKSSVDFNENLASFIGEQGALRFLRSAYGENSNEYQEYVQRRSDHDAFAKHMIRGAAYLDSVYAANADRSEAVRKVTKQKAIDEVVSALDTVHFSGGRSYSSRLRKQQPNNAWFVNYIRYDSQKDEMLQEMQYTCGGDVRTYLKMLLIRYAS